MRGRDNLQTGLQVRTIEFTEDCRLPLTEHQVCSTSRLLYCCAICKEEMLNNPHNLSDAEIIMIENLDLNAIKSPDLQVLPIEVEEQIYHCGICTKKLVFDIRLSFAIFVFSGVTLNVMELITEVIIF